MGIIISKHVVYELLIAVKKEPCLYVCKWEGFVKCNHMQIAPRLALQFSAGIICNYKVTLITELNVI